MNFVAHAVVAWRERAEAPFAFGAMVPDLTRIAQRAEPQPSRDAEVMRAGIAAHHRADSAFHDHELFRTWTDDVAAATPGSRRGAKAAAHVAVELAIDGLLVEDAATAPYDDALDWAAPVFDGTWQQVVARMRTGDILEAYGNPDRIAGTVAVVMRRRPRLAPIVPEPGDLSAALTAVVPAIRRALPGLLDGVSESSLM